MLATYVMMMLLTAIRLKVGHILLKLVRRFHMAHHLPSYSKTVGSEFWVGHMFRSLALAFHQWMKILLGHL